MRFLLPYRRAGTGAEAQAAAIIAAPLAAEAVPAGVLL
jgi:hypothetical protein